MSAQLVDSYTRELLDADELATVAAYHPDADRFPSYVAESYTDPDDARAEVRRLQIRGQLLERLAEHGKKKTAPAADQSDEGEKKGTHLLTEKVTMNNRTSTRPATAYTPEKPDSTCDMDTCDMHGEPICTGQHFHYRETATFGDYTGLIFFNDTSKRWEVDAFIEPSKSELTTAEAQEFVTALAVALDTAKTLNKARHATPEGVN